MINTNFLKTAFLIAVLAFSCGNIQAQCDISDDFSNISGSITGDPPMQTTLTSPNGWTGYNVALEGGSIVTYFASADVRGLNLRGNINTPGSIVSPVLPDGCSSIYFKCAVRVAGSNVTMKLKIEVLQDGTATWEDTYELSGIKGNSIQEYNKTLDANITGEYQLRITNLCPNGVTGTQKNNNYIIWDICLTANATPALAPPTTTSSTSPKTPPYL